MCTHRTVSVAWMVYVREMSHVRGHQVLCTYARGMKCLVAGNRVARNVLRMPVQIREGRYAWARATRYVSANGGFDAHNLLIAFFLSFFCARARVVDSRLL